MKKIISVVLCFMFVSSLFLPVIAFAGYKKEVNIINKSAAKTRIFKDAAGKSYTVKYVQTNDNPTQSSLPHDKRIDKHGTSDMYRDSKGNIAYYFYNTDKLISWRLKHNPKNDKPISQDEAKKIADDYLKKLHGNKLNSYPLMEARFQENMKYYTFEYNRKIGKYFTDDGLSVRIDMNGTIYGYSAENFERYKGFKTSDVDKRTAKIYTENNKTHGHEYPTILTLDDNTGKLIPIRFENSAKWLTFSTPKKPKTSFKTKKVTTKTKKINVVASNFIKNQTFVAYRKHSKGKKSKVIAQTQVKRKNTTLKLNKKILKKGDKIQVYTYTLYSKGDGTKKIHTRNGTSRIFTIR